MRKLEIRNQNGAKRHRPSIFLKNKTVKSEGLGALGALWVRISNFSIVSSSTVPSPLSNF